MSIPGVGIQAQPVKPVGKGDHEEEEHQQQWRREFENTDHFVGRMRDYIIKSREEDRLIHGATVRVRHVTYTSPLLDYSLHDVTSMLRSCFGLLSMERLTSKRKKILDDISFTMPAKSMTIVLGSPGSGKSSLCKILAQQDVQGKAEGHILFGGEEMEKRDHHHRVAFVRDHENHLPFLTVKQTLTFADALLNPADRAKFREEKLEMLMELLGLSHRADTLVGNDLVRGVSGGERRRVSIGVELVKSAQLLVLDEATNGLDSTTALNIFQALRIVADEMVPVVATLKQPAQELFELFDQVLLLHEGSQLYFGPRAGALPFFESLGFEVNFDQNPADEILRLIFEHKDELEDLIERRRAERSDTLDAVHSEEQQQDSDDTRKRLQRAETKVGSLSGEVDQMHRYRRYARSWPMQVVWYVIRGYQILFNFPVSAIARVIFAAVVALIIGTLFFQLGNTQSDLNSLSGVTFLISSFAGFQALAGLPGVFAMRPVFYYQKHNHYYHPIPSVFSQVIVDLPVSFSESMVFATVCYWLVGLRPLLVSYVYFMLCVLLVALVFLMITTTTGFVTKDFLMANILVPPLIFGLNYFSGFVVVESRAPSYFRWLYWVSPFRYVLEGLTINQMLDYDFVCEDDEMVPAPDVDGFNDSFEAGGYEGNQVCPVTSGTQMLLGAEYHTEEAYKWYWLLVLVGFFVLMLIVTILSKYFEFKPRIPRDMDRAENLHQQHLKPLRSLKESLVGDSDTDDDGDDEEDGSKSVNPLMTVKPQRLTNTTPVHIEFRDICYFVPISATEGTKGKLGRVPCFAPCTRSELSLLDNVSGYVEPGMVVAFMGPSGAGKTTLLDVLSLRKTAGRMTGTILINGKPMDEEMFPRYSGYVEQMNLHVETETVKEALEFAAKMRLDYCSEHRAQGMQISWAQIHEHVAWVLEVLDLFRLRHVMIQELNLEQKKRLTIGVELAANPSLLWLDEPTTGLDGLAAFRIMKAVRTIADSGVAVVCTLHQPSKQIFSMCSDLLLLAAGGRVSYFGSIEDGGAAAESYFAGLGLPMTPGRNPADYFLDCVSSKEVCTADRFLESDRCQELMAELDEGCVPRWTVSAPQSRLVKLWRRLRGRPEQDMEANEGCIEPPDFEGKYTASFFWQAVMLTNRSARYWWRNPESLVGMMARSLAFGLLLGLLFSGIDHTQAGATERVSCLYFFIMVLSSSAMVFVPQIFGERPVLYRETAAKSYSSSAYLLSLVVSAMPIILGTTMLVLLPVYFLAGLRGGWWHFGYLVGFACLTYLVIYGFVQALCALAPTAEAGNGLVSMVSIIGSLSAGFLLVRSEIPVYWIWAYWTAFLHYSLEGILSNELDGMRFHCPNNEGALPVPVPDAAAAVEMTEEVVARVQWYCPITSGTDIMDQFDMNPDLLLVDLLVLIGMFCLLMLVSWVAMVRLRHITR